MVSVSVIFTSLWNLRGRNLCKIDNLSLPNKFDDISRTQHIYYAFFNTSFPSSIELPRSLRKLFVVFKLLYYLLLTIILCYYVSLISNVRYWSLKLCIPFHSCTSFFPSFQHVPYTIFILYLLVLQLAWFLIFIFFNNFFFDTINKYFRKCIFYCCRLTLNRVVRIFSYYCIRICTFLRCQTRMTITYYAC